MSDALFLLSICMCVGYLVWGATKLDRWIAERKARRVTYAVPSGTNARWLLAYRDVGHLLDEGRQDMAVALAAMLACSRPPGITITPEMQELAERAGAAVDRVREQDGGVEALLAIQRAIDLLEIRMIRYWEDE